MKKNTRFHQIGRDAQREQKNGHEIKLCDVIT